MGADSLLNLVGFSLGVALYAMLLAMLIPRRRGGSWLASVDWLLVVTALLGLAWNVLALISGELPRLGIAGPLPLPKAVAIASLGFLPAVMVHSVLRGEHDAVRGARRVLVGVAYTVAGVAAALNLWAGAAGLAVPSVAAMRLLTYGFVALVLPVAAVTRGQAGARRALWIAALSVFAVSAFHLSELHGGHSSWPIELIGHHASLPLALAILYQDYPFALADLFLKRALSLMAIVGIALGGIGVYAGVFPSVGAWLIGDAGRVGFLVVLWVAAAILYPEIGRLAARFVDAVVFHRPDYAEVRATIVRKAQACDSETALLDAVSAVLAPALSARRVTWHEWYGPPGDDGGPTVMSGPDAAAWAQAGVRDKIRDESIAIVVVVPTADPPRWVLLVSALTRGRRVLSGDRTFLESAAIVVARRIDAIRITGERHAREIRERDVVTLVREAELRALRAQINPHFLFNALTTIGYLVRAAPDRAIAVLLRLTSLLRAALKSDGPFTTLGRELDLVESYLEIEHARFEERLHVAIDVPDALRGLSVPSFVLQPLVENAVRHGIANRQQGGTVTITGRVERTDSGRDVLLLVVQDTGAGTTRAAFNRGMDAGVGIRNIERRLAGLFVADAGLTVHTAPGAGTTVEVRCPAEPADAAVSARALVR
jgi:two-component system LytT family sensor kinase